MGVVAKKGGEMWKALSDAAKSPYEAKAKAAKEEHAKFLATEEGQAAKLAKKAGVKGLTEEEKAALTNDKVKKPLTAYFAWLGDNRENIAKIAGSNHSKVLAPKAAEM